MMILVCDLILPLGYEPWRLQRPPLPILAAQALIRFRAIRDCEVLRVPLELLACAVCDRSQQDGFS